MATEEKLPDDGSRFETYMQDVVINGFIALNVGIGSRLRLFENLAENSKEKPVTSLELAQITGFKERYLREWLSGMATAKVIDYDSAAGGFFLSPHKLQVVQTSPNFSHMVSFAEMLAPLGALQEGVINCFPESGPPGIPYSHCGGVFDWISRRQPFKFTEALFTDLFAHASELRDLLNRGVEVVDLGCGSGGAIKALAQMFPASSFLGLDLIEDNLKNARIACNGLPNVKFQLADICNIPSEFNDRFDVAIGFDVLHDLSYPEQFLDGVVRILRAGAQFLLNEVNVHSDLESNIRAPFSSALYSISLHFCMPTSLNAPGGRGLGTCAGAEVYEAMLHSSGLTDICRVGPEEIGLFFCCRKPFQ